MMELKEAADVNHEQLSHAAAARKKYGLHMMREDGWTKVRMGTTTVDEIVRVTQAIL